MTSYIELGRSGKHMVTVLKECSCEWVDEKLTAVWNGERYVVHCPYCEMVSLVQLSESFPSGT